MEIDLDAWEADACLAINYGENPQRRERSKRILVLISRLKSAEDALKFYADQDSYEWDGKIIDDGRKRRGFGTKARNHFEKYTEDHINENYAVKRIEEKKDGDA